MRCPLAVLTKARFTYKPPQIYGKKKKSYTALFHRSTKLTAWWFYGFQPSFSQTGMEHTNLEPHVHYLGVFFHYVFSGSFWGEWWYFTECVRCANCQEESVRAEWGQLVAAPSLRRPGCRVCHFPWVDDHIWPVWRMSTAPAAQGAR